MDSRADLSNESTAVELGELKSKKSEMLIDSVIEKNVGTRRSSDGGPPPFNRNRSFKTKQLVRSQAIRESQSPPRIPSPRHPGMQDSHDNHPNSAMKIKSASFDMDDRPLDSKLICDTTLISEKSMLSNSTDEKNSFKTTNVTSKNLLVFTSGDKKTLGANIINENTFSLECKNNDKTTKENSDTSGKQEPLDKTKQLTNQLYTVKLHEDKQILQNNNNNNSSDHDAAAKRQLTVMQKEHIKNENDSNSEELDYCNNRCSSLAMKNVSSNSSNQAQIIIRSQGISQDFENAEIKETCDKNFLSNNFHKNLSTNEMKVVNQLNLKNNQQSSVHSGTELNQIEIQVTSGDTDYTTSLSVCKKNEHSPSAKTVVFHPYNNTFLCNKDCDCGIGPSLEFNEDGECIDDEEKYYNVRNNGGRRAMCASKQDSGVCCWESCNCCGDISPEVILSDAEDDNRIKCQKSICDHEHHTGCDVFRSGDRNEKWIKRNGSTLSVQRSNSGGNPRLLRKQSSGGGSIDSGQHSIASPFLSRDSSTEANMACWDGDISKFIKDTLNKNLKDRQTLLKIEDDMINFIRDPNQKELKFPAVSSYGRLLVHRCADLFGLRHMLDPVCRSIVIVGKLPTTGMPYKIPSICPFKQWCVSKFPSSPTNFYENIPQAKSILKRDAQSFDDEPSLVTAGPPKLLQTPKSKSFEQREEEYVKARRRIFNTTGHFQSMENTAVTPNVRGVVLKAHSFGGYGGRPGMQRGDSVSSSTSAPPHRILSRQGELASNCWRLSPCSSGYKTLSARSDSITPSPTSTPNTAADNVNKNSSSGNENETSKGNNHRVPGVLWAISDMATVPSGAVIIHPQTGEALTNSDGSLYHYDPSKPLHSALLPPAQLAADNIKVLSNPERRRSRLEKQRATLSPGVEIDSINDSKKSFEAQNDTHIADCSREIEYKNSNIQTPEISFNYNIHLPKPENLNTVTEDYEQNLDSLKSDSEINISNMTQIEYDSNRVEENPDNQLKFEDTNDLCIKENDNLLENHKEVSNNDDLHSKEYYNHEDNKPINVNYDSNENERKFENYAISHYPEMNGSTYYNLSPHISSSQYFQQGPIYNDNNPEIYPESHQQFNYMPRPNETIMPSNTLPSQIPHPHIVFAPPPESMGITPGNEMCYPTVQGPMLIQPPHYRFNEQDPSQSSYHLIPTMDQQQPVIVALANKMPEQELSAQHLASYPVAGYHPQMERSAIVGPPPLLGMAPPHNPVGYQFQTTPSWGCWPQMAVYAPQAPTIPINEDPQKYQGHGYLPQPPPEAMNAVPQQFYPHTNLIHAQTNQFYSPYSQPTQMVPTQIPIYPQYNQGRSSVLSQEGCVTPSFQTFDPQANGGFKNMDHLVQEELYKSRNVKSPKSITSRGPSVSGSSRTTPLTNIGPLNPDQNGDSGFCTNYHFMHPTINYIPYPYPYNVTGVDCLQMNFENSNVSNNTKVHTNDKQNGNKSNKSISKEKMFSNNSQNGGAVHNSDNILSSNLKHQSEKNSNTLLVKSNLSVNVNLEPKHINKAKDKRKYGKSESLNEQDLIDAKNSEHNNNNITKGTQFHTQENQHKQIFNDKDPVLNKGRTMSREVKSIQREIRDITNKFSNLSNDAKTFVPKTQVNAESNKSQLSSGWNAKDGKGEICNVNMNDQALQMKIQSKQTAGSVDQNSANQQDTKANWRKFQNQKESLFHNFPKNLNKLAHRQSLLGNDKDRPNNRNQSKDKNPAPNVQKHKFHPKSENSSSPIQTTPMRLNTPPTSWNHQIQPSQNSLCGNPIFPNDLPGLFPTPNVHQPPPVQHVSQLVRPPRSNDSPAPASRGNWNRVNSLDGCLPTPQHRLMETSLIGLPLPQNASFYQRTQALQNFAGGGLSVLQTPPVQGQSTFLFRQVSNWVRRPGPALFGPPPPPLSGQVRSRPPRHQQPRFSYH